MNTKEKVSEAVKEGINNLLNEEIIPEGGNNENEGAGRIIDAEDVDEILSHRPRVTSKGKLDLTKEQLNRIPRPGESIFLVDRYPVNDDEDASRQETICAYSIAPVLVMSASLAEDMKRVYVNADIELSLVKKSSLRDDGREIFANEDEAYERWEELMDASLKVATKEYDEAKYKMDFVKKALKEKNF